MCVYVTSEHGAVRGECVASVCVCASLVGMVQYAVSARACD